MPSYRLHRFSALTQAAEQAMRSWGVDASERTMQFRMPSKMAQTGSGASLEMAAHVRFGCRL